MAHDQEVAARVRALMAGCAAVEEKPVFGVLGFLLGGHLAVCVDVDGGLLVRVPRGEQDALLAPGLVEPMRMGARISRTWVEVSPDAVRAPSGLSGWVDRGVATVAGLPPKDR